MSQNQCKFIFTKGLNKGSQCPTLITEGDFCKTCKLKSSAKVLSDKSILINKRLDKLEEILNGITIKTDDLTDVMTETQILMNHAMRDRLVGKRIMNYGKRVYETSGAQLETYGGQLGMDLAVLPGKNSQMYSDGTFSFEKRLTKQPVKINWDLFQEELIKLGISNVLIQQTLEKATYKGMPSTYLEVNTV